MGVQNQATAPHPLRGGDGTLRRNRLTPRAGLGSKAKTAIIVLALGLLGGEALGMLLPRPNENPSSNELVASFNADKSSETPASESATPASADATARHAPQQTDGRRYRVVVGTAYFFDAPEQSVPNGKYLRRNDTFYGEGELNGFVKTGYVNPDGSRSIGWLKVQELSRLPESAPPIVASRSKPRPKPKPAAAVVYADAGTDAREPQERPRTTPGGAKTAAVQAARSYFYDSPNLTTPRKAHCVRGDQVRLGESRGNAVYVTFTNWEKVTTTGWMRKDALGLNP